MLGQDWGHGAFQLSWRTRPESLQNTCPWLVVIASSCQYFVINNHKLDLTSSLSDSNIMQYPFIYHYRISIILPRWIEAELVKTDVKTAAGAVFARRSMTRLRKRKRYSCTAFRDVNSFNFIILHLNVVNFIFMYFIFMFLLRHLGGLRLLRLSHLRLRRMRSLCHDTATKGSTTGTTGPRSQLWWERDGKSVISTWRKNQTSGWELHVLCCSNNSSSFRCDFLVQFFRALCQVPEKQPDKPSAPVEASRSTYMRYNQLRSAGQSFRDTMEGYLF